jgi:copper homeostasis protein
MNKLKKLSQKNKAVAEKSKHINIMAGGGLDFHNIKDIMKNAKVPQYHFGTAVRYDKSVSGEVDE